MVKQDVFLSSTEVVAAGSCCPLLPVALLSEFAPWEVLAALCAFCQGLIVVSCMRSFLPIQQSHSHLTRRGHLDYCLCIPSLDESSFQRISHFVKCL